MAVTNIHGQSRRTVDSRTGRRTHGLHGSGFLSVPRIGAKEVVMRLGFRIIGRTPLRYASPLMKRPVATPARPRPAGGTRPPGRTSSRVHAGGGRWLPQKTR